MRALNFYRSAYNRMRSLNAFILERYRECEAEVLLSQERREKGTLNQYAFDLPCVWAVSQ